MYYKYLCIGCDTDVSSSRWLGLPTCKTVEGLPTTPYYVKMYSIPHVSSPGIEAVHHCGLHIIWRIQNSSQSVNLLTTFITSSFRQYLALAPKKVHPNQVYQLYITLFSMPFGQLNIRAILSNNGEEYASVTETVYEKGTKRLQLLVSYVYVCLVWGRWAGVVYGCKPLSSGH